ncbi:MAG: helix-turn-helix transcriptional regulator [Oscillospiraceae bacterium]|nr:helix-turn-helix transcriptional regulator [Oscillospiraceae bacterium]
MSREETLMQLIKLKYRSLHNFSLESGIPNSTLNSMFKKGLGGTSFDTVLKVCSLLECDIYSLIDEDKNISAEDHNFFSKYLSLDKHSKDLVKIVTEHQLSTATAENVKPAAKVVEFPAQKTLSVRTMRVYVNSASAGFGEYLEESDYEDFAVGDEVPYEADFGITIHGDSMTPEIADGDVVWVRAQDSVESNQIGVFVLNGDALCKKLIAVGGRFFLRSLNQKYKDIPITEYDSLKVIGRVIDATPFPAY